MSRGFARAALLLGAALLAGHALAQTPPAERSTSWLQRRIESGLASALGGSVHIGRMDVEWTGLAATVHDVSISIPAGSAPPLNATMREGRVTLAWSGLAGLAGGDVRITEVVARGATFSCSREWVDAWRPPTKEGGGEVAVQIDRLVLEDSSAEYLDGGQRVRLRAAAMSFHGDWSSARRLLVGEIRAETTVEAPMFGRPWPATVHGGLRVGAGRLEIFGATGEGPGVSAELAGTVTWTAGASFTAQGRMAADLAALNPYTVGSLPLSGRVEGPVQIVYTNGVPIRVTMKAAATALRIGPIATDRAVGDLTIRPGHLDVAGIDAKGYGGVFSGTVGLTFGEPLALQTDLKGAGADLARLIALAGKDLPIASRADVTLKIVGDPGKPATWSGGGTFEATPEAAGEAKAVPVGGRGRLMFEAGRIRVEADPLALAGATLRLGFEADISSTAREVHVALAGATSDAKATQAAALRLFDALGIPRQTIVAEPVEGRGTVRADVRVGQKTRVDLVLALSSGSWSGEPFDSAALDLSLSDAEVEIRRLEASEGEQSLTCSARFDVKSRTLEAVDVHGRDLGLKRMMARLGAGDSLLDGRLDVDLEGSREDGLFAAVGHASVHRAIVGREIIDTIEAPLLVEGSQVFIDGAKVRALGLEIDGTIVYDLERARAEIEVDSAHVYVAANRTLAEAGLAAKGSLLAHGSLVVDRDGAAGLLTVLASNLVLDTGRSGLRDVRLGDLRGTVTVSPRGLEIAVAATPQPEWTFEGFLGFAPSLPLSAVLYFENLVVGAGGLFGESADLRLKGQVQAEGELTAPRAFEINGAFDEVSVRLGPRVVRAVEPFPVRLEAGRFQLGPCRFQGDTVDLELAGSGSLEGGGVAGYARGSVDLAIVSSLWSEIRGAGPVAVDATLGGTIDEPDLRGTIKVHDGRMRLIGIPQSLESISAAGSFDGKAFKLDFFHAFYGGGEVDASAQLDLQGFRPATYRAVVSGANVVASFPEGFKGTYEGRVTVEGTPKRALISGRIEIVRGLYGKDFDTSILGGAHREFGGESESRIPRNLFLDVDVVAPGNVWLRNDIAKIEATGQAHIGGELARPEITGRLSLVPGGSVRYRDVDYRIEYGTVDLTDPKRLNPYVDLRGQTRVADYQINLRIEGTLDKFDYELTSSPPLSSQDIISLLVTGKTLDSLSGSATAAALPADMAAYYFAGLLSSGFGKQIQSSLGIDQLEVTPIFLKGEADPTARVTVGKRVSDTVKILFSQDIGSAQKQTYQVGWDVTRRVRLLAESDSDTGLGGEVQYSRQFGGTPIGEKDVDARGRAGEPTDLPGSVSEVRVESEDGSPRADLVKASSIRAGDPFVRGRMLQGGDLIRTKLLKQGFLQASVRAEATAREGPPRSYTIVYRVVAGPRVAVELVVDGGKAKRSLRKVLKEFWRETPYMSDSWDDAAKALLDALQEDGYYAADVTWHATDTPAGRTVRIDVDRGKPVRLRAIHFTGIAAIPRERIDKQMSSLKSQGLRKRLLRPSVLAADLAAVRALYREEGFTRVRISPPQVSLAATGDSAEVEVAVTEGERFVVGELTFSGGGSVPEAELARWTKLKPGDTFSPRRLSEAEQSLRDGFDAKGYPETTVESVVELAEGHADIAFEIVNGPKKTVGEIAIEGNRITKTRTIARGLTFGRNDLVSNQALLSSQQQLYRTGLFSSVRLTAAPLGGEDNPSQKVTVRVEEAPPLSLGLGVGYDSTDGPRASFLIGYSNLGGRMVGITFQSRVSPKENQEVLTVRRRRVFGDTIDSLGSLLYEKSIENFFTQTRTGLSIRLEQRPKPRWIRYLRYNIQEVQIYDITDAQAALDQIFEDKLSNLRLGSLALGLVRDTRDDAFIPTQGGYGSIEGSIFAKPLGSQATFGKLFLRGSWVAALKRGSRFESFIRAGAEYPFGDTQIVPLSERFFAGGASTLRGFGDDSVGGLVIAGHHAGGEAIFLLNEQLSLPIWRSLRGEIFLDAGNVYSTISDFNPIDLRSSAGLGFRLDTPIGPIRVEYGWKLDRREGESAGELIFAIGTIF